MAKTKVGINGFGRIGRNFLRAHVARRGDFEIVVVNDLAEPEILAHLLRYDSSHGRLDGVEVDGDRIGVDGTSFQVLAERDPKALPWGDMGIDVVVESTGLFTDREGAQQHLEAGAKKVLISAPATDPDITLVLGVNDDGYDPDSHHIVSMASCTLWKPTPRSRKAVTVSMRCLSDRPRRSSFQTTSRSPARRSAWARSRPGRSALVPPALSVEIFSHPAAFRASSWRSRFCSRVETLA